MNSKTRFIPLVIIGAILLSLLAVVPAFGAGEVGFIDPNDIDDNGALSDPTPDVQEWARQAGRIGLMLTDSDLDTPVRRVLIPSIDAKPAGQGTIAAHQKTISGLSATALAKDDYVLIGMHHVRKVASVKTEDGVTTVTVDKAFSEGMTETVHRIRDTIAKASSGSTVRKAWDDNYSSYAMAEMIQRDQPTLRRGDTRFTNNSESIIDSDVSKGIANAASVTPLDRLSGSGTGSITRSDVLLVKVSGSTVTNVSVDEVSSSGEITVFDVPNAVAGNALGLGAGENAYLVYWAAERNETGSLVTVRSQAHQDPVTLVLKETTASSGEFVLEIMTVKPQDDSNPPQDVMPDTDTTPPTLPVNPRDVVTLSHPDQTGSVTIETTKPVFSGFAPAHGTSGKDERPVVSAQVIDGDSGLTDKSIKVLFRLSGDLNKDVPYKTPESQGNVDDISGGFEFTQQLLGSDVLTFDDGMIEWWVMATDKAGNVGYSDRQPTKDGNPDVCTADSAEMSSAQLEAAKCQPFAIHVDGTASRLLRAQTGRSWNSGLTTGKSDDKTEYRVSKADSTSVLVVFDEHLDDSTITASDFEVDDSAPIEAEAHNVKVRNDVDTDATMEGMQGGDGNSDIVGDDVQDVGAKRGYVFLTVEEMNPNARPKVELVGEVSDIAGNRLKSGKDSDADDRVAPTLAVTLMEGDRPVTKDKVNLTITSDENVGAPSVMYYKVMSVTSGDTTTQTLGGMLRASSVVFKSATEYTAVIDPANDGLYTVYVAAPDASGGNEGSIGDKSQPVDVEGETSAILFERDTKISAPDFDPDKSGVNDKFSIDDPNAFIRIDFSGEGDEYDAQENGDDLDTHGMVTIVSATLGGEDISGGLQANDASNIFLFHASGLDLGEHKLEITAMDEAGNKNTAPFKGTITITERKPYTLKLNPGWNLVSIPGEPMDSDINAVISADHPAMTVLTYDPSVPGGWLTALRGSDGSFSGTLTDITAGRAYWINTPSFQGLKVDIPKQSAGVAQVLPTISIAVGWNLIPILDVDGDFKMDDATADDNYFDGLSDGAVTGIYTFNTITNSWSSVAEEDVEIGKGYWIYANKAGVIVP